MLVFKYSLFSFNYASGSGVAWCMNSREVSMSVSRRSEDPQQQPCPEIQAGIFSKISFNWLNDILKLGYNRPLNPSDLYTLDESFLSTNVGMQLEAAWKVRSSRTNSKWPLFWALSDAFGRKLYLSGLAKFVGDSCSMASPYVLRMLIKNMESSNVVAQFFRSKDTNELHRLNGYLLCLLLFGLQLAGNMIVNFYFTVNFRVGLRARTALNSAVYKKTQKLSGSARQEFSTGQMVNLISNDSSRLENSTLFFHYMWSGPFQIIAILSLLYTLIGVSVFAGLLMFVIFIPVQSKITTWLSKYRKVATILIMNVVL